LGKQRTEKRGCGFERSFDVSKIDALTGGRLELFRRLKDDVIKGEVFAAVRKEEIHFYYKGGRLYKFNGNSFFRDGEYEKYSQNTDYLGEYDKAKKQNENKFLKADGAAKERRLLDKLYRHTFCRNEKSKVVVLDIEVRLNGETDGAKKCDMVLLNTEPPLPKIMFVEGKAFNDSRVNVKAGFVPEVIAQVNTYSRAIAEQAAAIVFEYINHIDIINRLFDTRFEAPIPSSLYNFHVFGYDLFVQNHLIPKAKLLVYNTPKRLTGNGEYSVSVIDKELGENNVMWAPADNEPALDEIWEALCK
jgi:hypothetical protein